MDKFLATFGSQIGGGTSQQDGIFSQEKNCFCSVQSLGVSKKTGRHPFTVGTFQLVCPPDQECHTRRRPLSHGLPPLKNECNQSLVQAGICTCFSASSLARCSSSICCLSSLMACWCFFTFFSASIRPLLAESRAASSSLISPSSFFLARTASALPRCSASRDDSRDSRACWWFFLKAESDSGAVCQFFSVLSPKI